MSALQPPIFQVVYTDPTGAPGIAAAVGTIVQLNGSTSAWVKSGPNATDWQVFPGPSSALATKATAGLLPSTGVPAGLLPAALFKSFCSLGADASGAPTHIAAVGAKVGDSVVMAANTTDHASAAADFEATVTVADQIQQTAVNLSAKTLVILVIAQS